MSYESLQDALDASRRAAEKTYETGRASLGRCDEAIEATESEISWSTTSSNSFVPNAKPKMSCPPTSRDCSSGCGG
jgi:hypothetical protein